MSLLTLSFLLSCRLIFISTPHILYVFSCQVLSQAPCRSEAFGQAPLQSDNTVSGPECFGSQTHTEGRGLISLWQPQCCTLDLLSTARRLNGSKLFSELEPFRTCSMEM